MKDILSYGGSLNQINFVIRNVPELETLGARKVLGQATGERTHRLTANRTSGGTTESSNGPRFPLPERTTAKIIFSGREKAASVITPGETSTTPIRNKKGEGKRRTPEEKAAIRIKPEQYSELEEVIKAHNETVTTAIRAQFGHQLDPHTIEDIIAITWGKVADNWGSFEQGTNMFAWIKKIAQNTALSTLRRSKSLQEIPVDPHASSSDTGRIGDSNIFERVPDGDIAPDELAMRIIEKKIGTKLVEGGINPNFVTALIETQVEGRTHNEAAERMGVEQGTSLSRTFRGRSQLLALAGVTAKEAKTRAGADKVRALLASLE